MNKTKLSADQAIKTRAFCYTLVGGTEYSEIFLTKPIVHCAEVVHFFGRKVK